MAKAFSNKDGVAKRGRPKIRTHIPGKSSQIHTKEGEEKYIFLAKSSSIDSMKDIAYWDRLTIKETFEEAMQDRIAKFEKKNGPLKKRPAK